MTTVTVPWSKLLQQPNQVTAELEHTDAVRLARRDAEDLILTTVERADRALTEISTIARAFAAVVKHDDGARMAQLAMPEAFPWMRLMPEDAVEEFLEQFADTARACAEINVFAPLTQLVVEWKHTAEIYADPELYEHLTRPIDITEDYGPVTPPEVNP